MGPYNLTKFQIDTTLFTPSKMLWQTALVTRTLTKTILLLLFQRSICVSVSFQFSSLFSSILRSIGLKVTGAIDLVRELKWNGNAERTLEQQYLDFFDDRIEV